MPYCPNGHGEIQGKFCAECGAELVQAPPAPPGGGDSVRMRSPEAHASMHQTFVLPGAAPTAGPVLLRCPACGRRNPELETFDCQGLCGREGLCLRHFDEELNVCKDCADQIRHEAQAESQRQTAEAAARVAETLLRCPACGRRNPELETFDCQGPCGREGLCLRHFDEEYDVCANCADDLRQAAERARRQADERERTLTLAPGVTLELVRVPAGAFLMGSTNADDDADDDEKSQRLVHLDEYLIGKYPVTVAQYRAFAQATGHSGDSDALEDPDDHPVTWVSWDDAVAFCRWLSEVSGRPVRLPTEAEWEKAARGTDGRIYPWGDAFDATRCNTEEGGAKDTTPVGRYSPAGDSPHGCADMAGSVWEWVADWWDHEYYRKAGSIANPTGPSTGQERVVRGGSWDHPQRGARCAYRDGGTPNLRLNDIGFRVVVALPISQRS